MVTALPEYVRASVPSIGNRQPWHKSTAPSYAGIFLWVASTAGLRPAVIPEFQSANIPSRPAPASP